MSTKPKYSHLSTIDTLKESLPNSVSHLKRTPYLSTECLGVDLRMSTKSHVVKRDGTTHSNIVNRFRFDSQQN